MNRIKLSIRVPAAQDVMIRHIAEVRGLTPYQALARVIEAGVSAIMLTPASSARIEVDDGLASLEARLAVIEALTDRSLFTASAAYVYARRAALRGEGDGERVDTAMGEAVQSAYARQRSLAADGLS